MEFFHEEFDFWFSAHGKKLAFHKWQVHVTVLCRYVVKSYVASEAKLLLTWFAVFYPNSYFYFLFCLLGIENIHVVIDQKLLFATQPKSIF